MWKSVVMALIGATIASVAVAQEERRSPGKHEHGHGTLNMAIDGKRVLIEFHAPGSDIVGFEHHARIDADRAAVDRAMGMLKDPLTLFAMPADAACRVEKTHVALAGDDMKEHAERHTHEHGHGKERHMEFHAEYVLACDRPERIRRIDFPYFRLFPRSREFAVTVIDGGGQARYEVERAAPAVELKRAP